MKLHLAVVSLSLLFTAAPSAKAQVAPLCESILPYDYDSGKTSSPTSTDISHKGAPWIQLDLSGTELAPGAKLILVGAETSQEFDAAELGVSSNGHSAEFDGDRVSVELIAGDGDPGLFRGGRAGPSPSRVVVSAIKVGLCDEDDKGGAKSICGPTDRRVGSAEKRVGRIGGCTGWLIGRDVFVQAGHCGTPGSASRIHFTSGTGNAPAADQYAVEPCTYKGVNGGIGNDWGVGRLLPTAGRLPGDSQSWYDIGTVPGGPNNNDIRITGYGTAATFSRRQRTHVGDLTQVAGTSLRYDTDTTGGNSGSPVVHEQTGHAIGVHTHGGCQGNGNNNGGTRIDRADFRAHIDFLLRSCSSNSQCPGGTCSQGRCHTLPGTPGCPAPAPPPPSPPSCMSGETRVGIAGKKASKAKSKPVRDLDVGDVIEGLDENMEPAICSVEAVGHFGTGVVFGNYTQNHFVLDPSDVVVRPNGDHGEIERADLHTVLTSCPVGVDESGVGFTAFAETLFGDQALGWSDYVLIHKSIVNIVREVGPFVFYPSTYTSMKRVNKYTHKLYKTMLTCAKNPDKCDAFEEAAVNLVENALTKKAKKMIKSGFGKLGDAKMAGSVAAAVSNGKSIKD